VFVIRYHCLYSVTSKNKKLCYSKDDRAMRAIYVDRKLLWRYGHSKLSKMAAAAILNLFESKIAPLDTPSPKTSPYNQTSSGSDDRLRRYGYLKFFQDGGRRHLGFVRIENSAIRYAVPENPILEQNMKWIGPPVAEIWPLRMLGAYVTPVLGEGEVVGVQRWHH